MLFSCRSRNSTSTPCITWKNLRQTPSWQSTGKISSRWVHTIIILNYNIPYQKKSDTHPCATHVTCLLHTRNIAFGFAASRYSKLDHIPVKLHLFYIPVTYLCHDWPKLAPLLHTCYIVYTYMSCHRCNCHACNMEVVTACHMHVKWHPWY